ncbi:MAG: Uncharacterized protein G01um101448_491 [Parcubacteria group bacterium Gr01-1014_48]|nr:MAG: Uncharacterized protein Greene041614_810 [Parcubacteria group bacterium Greene0416_14]TSC73848.1 MAG: Uncharacterized protein G01um101448_491 [Parcubacteria group bacterium Gr01-1014_48]TSD00401.1 MAG: Uncharacterized protein Greene101415_859 [Parcubacteria group bacterium Greene1014_15]TSD07733.1 MAG: Uncharacterized protein Greene07144_765 [Parcubacteria group bacterium Greene0714_4]
MKQSPRHVCVLESAISVCAILFFIIVNLIGEHTAQLTKKTTLHLSKEEAADFIQKRMKQCYESTQQKSCYQQAVIGFLDHLPLNQILKTFGTYEKNTEFFMRCHEVAHYLGQEAYHRTKSVREVFKEGSHVCLAGVFHGAIEGYFIEKGMLDSNDALYAKEIPRVCGKQEEYSVRQQFVECNHGMGHAVMFLAENDLLRALKLCDFLATSPEQELCYTGAFMANAAGTQSTDHPSKYLPKPEDPLYPCPLLDTKYQKQCYTYGILEAFQPSIEQSIKACGLIPEKYRNACFQTVGRNRTVYSADPLVLKEQCEQISELSFQHECIQGVAYNLVIRFGALSSLPDQFCAHLNPETKQNCLLQIQSARNVASQHENN